MSQTKSEVMVPILTLVTTIIYVYYVHLSVIYGLKNIFLPYNWSFERLLFLLLSFYERMSMIGLKSKWRIPLTNKKLCYKEKVWHTTSPRLPGCCWPTETGNPAI